MGGNGNSTEHTAWLNLKKGIPAPLSGAIATNGKTIAEQIGAQIFIDSWALVAPGQPQLAASLAKTAASVSHDGESVYAAMLWAAMESQAFICQDIEKLIATGLSVIPQIRKLPYWSPMSAAGAKRITIGRRRARKLKTTTATINIPATAM